MWISPRAPDVFIPYSVEFNIEGLRAVTTRQSDDTCPGTMCPAAPVSHMFSMPGDVTVISLTQVHGSEVHINLMTHTIR